MPKTAVFQDPLFHDEDRAREALEAVRWPDGPVCPHCGNSDQEKLALIEGQKKSHRPGLRYCVECKGQFTVTVGTVFERSKIPLDVAPDSYPVGLRVWWLPSCTIGTLGQGAEPLASAAPWPRCGKKFAA